MAKAGQREVLSRLGRDESWKSFSIVHGLSKTLEPETAFANEDIDVCHRLCLTHSSAQVRIIAINNPSAVLVSEWSMIYR